ncbi:ABC-three component system middle component 7 [Chryseobacterium sp.]|uniref:ABC-three component system middle component 7 n=1 Tax=Chryseobacterium sp. TaxID=1871047 RepID=UPI003FA572E2
MKLPNKVITYNESIISKFPIVLTILRKVDCRAIELYSQVKNQIEDIDDFIDVLDCLFALGTITLNEKTRRLHYAM